MESEALDLESMTTRERLFAMGLLEQYDQAQAARDILRVRALLQSVGIDEPSIERVVQRVCSGSMK